MEEPKLDIFCHVTGFTSDFLSFKVVELICFFHGALHFLDDEFSRFFPANPAHL